MTRPHPHPHMVKLAVETKAAKLAVTITGVHSVVCLDGDEVYAIFDVEPDESGDGLHFVFPMPESVSRGDLPAFASWLTRAGHCGCETIH